MSSLLAPPIDVLQTAVSDLQLSTFIAAVYAADLDRYVKRTPGVTYLMPRNRAFAQLGLTMNYLLLSEGKDDLRKVIKYHAIDSIVYTPNIARGDTVFKTLEGGAIVLSSGKHGNLTVRSPAKWTGHDSGQDLPSNGELRPGVLIHKDTLTETGVIHTVDSVMMPSDVVITLGKLVKGSKVGATMADLMIRSGLSWVLEGREPSSEEVQRVELEGIIRPRDDVGDHDEAPDQDEDNGAESLALSSYTLLCPTDKAFSKINITRYTSDPESLLKLLKLHIIPSPSSSTSSSSSSSKRQQRTVTPPKDGQPLSLVDDVVYSSLLSLSSRYGQLAFRATGDNGFLVGIKNARSGGERAVARVGVSGRASVRWKPHREELGSDLDVDLNDSSSSSTSKDGPGSDSSDSDSDNEKPDQTQLWSNGMTLGGGVIVIDSVLIPYEPSWWTLWGTVVIISIVGAVLLLAIGVWVGWWWMSRKDGYEPLEGEEEE